MASTSQESSEKNSAGQEPRTLAAEAAASWERPSTSGAGQRSRFSSRHERPSQHTDREGKRRARSSGPDHESKRQRRKRYAAEDAAQDAAFSGERVWGKAENKTVKLDAYGAPKRELAPGEEKEKANFGLSGALGKDERTGRMYKGVLMKWTEPADAVTPPGPGWRLFVFRKKEAVDTVLLHGQSAHLVGRDERVADIHTKNSSCSKQHAVIQFRIKTVQPPPGSLDPPRHFVRPYIIDLGSSNGTRLNGERLEPSRYYELLEKDILRFAKSSREYVVMFDEKAAELEKAAI
ncbi:Smad nuclear-interacting protein 1 [Hondaea fermentalgiana]|uniref:Smad nuclear-interacting protein 1 n=1 Tax=Hondaea fermentalgiana TaxID=2315210 RepID=A0A2R5G9Y0_9STRA|nr:Smad nuclear-interacting protein 1 [Hondaea fermentalgiana]|eukprot:GBG27840.1 Smad nuclear-interacting protein 1 [Hondaea fermentalgiana]